MSLRSEVRDSANVKPNMLAKHEIIKLFIRVSKNIPRKQNYLSAQNCCSGTTINANGMPTLYGVVLFSSLIPTHKTILLLDLFFKLTKSYLIVTK